MYHNYSRVYTCGPCEKDGLFHEIDAGGWCPKLRVHDSVVYEDIDPIEVENFVRRYGSSPEKVLASLITGSRSHSERLENIDRHCRPVTLWQALLALPRRAWEGADWRDATPRRAKHS